MNWETSACHSRSAGSNQFAKKDGGWCFIYVLGRGGYLSLNAGKNRSYALALAARLGAGFDLAASRS